MTPRTGFIGDIHGELELLDSMIDSALSLELSRLIFLGDYVNRGRESRAVIDRLITLQRSPEVETRFIAGNHDRALRSALETGRIESFLRIGGAATVRSYLDHVDPDVAAQFVRAVPTSHRDFLRDLEPYVLGQDFVAAHERGAVESLNLSPGQYGIFGHTPQDRFTPFVGEATALIDTGCGTVVGGRLTCLLWPSRDWFQISPS